MSLSQVVGIRAAREDDAVWLCDLAADQGLEVDVSEPLKLPQARIYVAPPAQGFLSVWIVQDELQIQDIAVEPSSRRRGIARALFQYAVAEARQQGVRSVTLEMRRSNHIALEFYRALGFMVVGQRPRYYSSGEAALLLTLQLSAEVSG